MKKISICIILFMSLGVFAQDKITLEACYQLVKINYPLAHQNALFEKQNAIDLDVIETERLPQLDFSAQATYQSDVIEIPIPNAGIEPQNRDQYRATLSVNQLIYGGGIIDASLEAKSTALKTQQKQIDVSLYQLKKQVNQLYFSILLSQEKYKLLTIKNNQLQAKLKEVKSGIQYGVLLPRSDKVLEAELLKLNQQFTEVENTKVSLIKTLTSLIGRSLNTSTDFLEPFVESEISAEINRPELELFRLKKEQIESSKRLISKQNVPKLFGFATGGYGNPGLNMLDNSFQSFYTVGVKLNWNIFDWNSNKKQRESLTINKDIINNETEIFRLNTNIELQQLQSQMDKIEAFIASDIEIINLRKEVLNSADSQLRNGVITSSAYITELTNLYADENTLITHKIQLELTKANYKITQGQ
jgi:outer membrane protein TolC